MSFLNKKAYKAYVELARHTLGAEYEGVSRFFADLFCSCFKLEDSESGQQFLVAFLTRRCHVLLEIFLKIFACYTDPACPVPCPPYLQGVVPSRIEKTVEKHFVTDANLITMAEEIAEYYHDSGRFPRIIILDEIILHGRAVNSLLLKVESGILHRLEQLEPEFDSLDRSLAVAKLSHSIDLQIYAQNNEPLLLLDRYSRRLHTSRLCNPIEIRKLSNGFATLVANGSVNNVACSWNFKLSGAAAAKFKMLSPSPGFVQIETHLKSILQTCALWLYPNVSKPRAVCGIRWKHGGKTPSDLLMVPFLITDRLPRRNLYRLHKRICEDLADLKLSFLTSCKDPNIGAADSCHLRWLFETNDLILSYLMFRRFCGKDVSAIKWELYLETAILARNYKLILPTGTGSKKVIKELKSIWNWSPPCPNLLEQYFDILLDGAQPLWDETISSNFSYKLHEIDENAPECKRLITAVEDTIAAIGYEAEQNAGEKYSSGIFLPDETLSDWGKKYSLSEMLLRCQKRWQELSGGDSMDIYAALALIVQETDLGILSINPQFDNSTDQVYSMMRAGEHSLFIKPTRYRDFIPVLIEIDKRCCDCQLDLCLEIKRFMTRLSDSQPDLETTAEELCDFMQDLERVNQKIKDWNLVLPDYGNSDEFDVSTMSRQIYYLQEYGKI